MRTTSIRGRWALIAATIGALAMISAVLTAPAESEAARRQTTAAATVPAPITPTPQVPEPEECDVEPRRLPLFEGTPLPDESGVDPTPTPFAIPAGELVDEDAAAAITAAIRGSLACRNAGDFLRAYAFYTDGFLSGLLGGPAGAASATEALLRPPTPVAATDRLALVHVSEVRRLEDGRVGAIVVTQSASHAYADYLYLVEEEDGRWLVDDLVFLSQMPIDAPPDP